MTRLAMLFGALSLLLLLPASAAAGVTYVPGPLYNDTFEPGTQYSYTLPPSMDERCAKIDCKYTTNLDDRIGYCHFGRGQDMLLEITVTAGAAQIYEINVSTWKFEPSEITITTGSTLVFDVIDNSTMHNIVLPWTTPVAGDESEETPGFGFDIVGLAMLGALFWIRLDSSIRGQR